MTKMLEFMGYFVVGGLVVALTTYFGSRGHGFLAALISMFPSMTVLTFFLLYRFGGNASVVGYAKSLVWLVPPWVMYVVTVAVLCERIGIWKALAIGVALYLVSSYLFHHFR